MSDRIQQNCTPSQSPLYRISAPNISEGTIKDQVEVVKPKNQIQNKKQTTQEKREEKQCRICLEGSSIGKLQKYCKCSGTAEFAHQNCITEWILRKEQKCKKIIKCEICHQQFNYDVIKHREFACSKLLSNWSTNKRQIFLFCFAIILCLSGFVYFINISFGADIASSVLREKMINSKACFIAVLVGVIIWVLMIGVLLYAFASKFLMKNFTMIRLDKANSLRYIKLAQSIKQYMNSNKTFASISKNSRIQL